MKTFFLRLAWLLVASVLAPLCSQAQSNQAQPPGQISYQGFLTDGNGVPLAPTTPQNYSVLFNIYTAGTGGTTLWGESQVVTVDRGFFTVLLGVGSAINGTFHTNDLTSLFNANNAQSRYVGLTVQGLPGVTTEIAPRLQLLSAPFALMAANAVNAAFATNAGSASYATNAANVTGSGTIQSTNLASNIGVWSASGGNIFRPGGNVGIGTSTPSSLLNLKGGNLTLNSGSLLMDNDGIIYGANTSGTYEQCLIPRWGDNVTYFNYGTGGLSIRNDNSSIAAMFMNNSGYVGINNTSPLYPLDVYGSIRASYPVNPEVSVTTGTGTLELSIASNAGAWSGGAAVNDAIIRSDNGKLLLQYSSGQPAITISTANYVGVGTTTPGVPLDVVGYNYPNTSAWVFSPNYGYDQYVGGGLAGYSGYTWEATGPNLPVSIRGQYLMEAYGYMTASDQRIKDVVGRTDTRRDLETIDRLVVTDYRLKDRAEMGDRPMKGLIAQEVQGVVPEAVSKGRRFIPSIYATAEGMSFDPAAKTLTISVGKPHELRSGDKVRLISKEATAEKEVLSVSSDRAFTVGDVSSQPEKLFVYGRQVDDFLTVDYNRIFTTGISAIQELHHEMELLAKQKDGEIARLRDANSVLAKGLADQALKSDALQARLEKLEKAMVARVEPPGAPKAATTTSLEIGSAAGR